MYLPELASRLAFGKNVSLDDIHEFCVSLANHFTDPLPETVIIFEKEQDNKTYINKDNIYVGKYRESDYDFLIMDVFICLGELLNKIDDSQDHSFYKVTDTFYKKVNNINRGLYHFSQYGFEVNDRIKNHIIELLKMG